MEPHITEEERRRAAEIAQRRCAARRAPVEMAGGDAAACARPAPAPPRTHRALRAQPQPRAQQPAPRPAQTAPRPAAPALASAGGRWRIQLGAFSSEANARRAWGAVAGRLPGLSPNYVRAGAVVRLQAGPLRDRAAAAARLRRGARRRLPRRALGSRLNLIFAVAA